MRFFILVLLFVLSPITVLADPPHAVINGPTEGMPGDFIDLDATGSTAVWYKWTVDPPQFTDGRKTYRLDRGVDPRKSVGCSIASRPGTYKVTLIVSTDGDDGGIDTKNWTVVIFANPPGTTPPVQPPPTNPNQPPPNQPPPTNPNQPPPPVDTDPIPGMTAWVRDQATALVPAEGRQQTAKLLAKAYQQGLERLSPLIKTDAKAFAQAQDYTNTGLLKLLQVQSKWDGFMTALAEKIAAANLTRPQQDKVWQNIIDGLEQVQ